jgi:MFS family permease
VWTEAAVHLISPDILTEARALSFGLLAAGLIVGLLLWLLGWWGHRFWIVLIATVGAGIFGLNAGPNYGLQPVVAGLLLAISAGVLALTLVRLFAYAAGGFAAWMLVHALAPLWDQPLLCFLAGGLVGLVLFRFWTMALTSFVGALFVVYSGLCLADRMDKLDSVAWAQDQGMLLNWFCGTLTLVGFVVQIFLERRRVRKLRETEDEEEEYHDRGSRYYRSRYNPAHRRAG